MNKCYTFLFSLLFLCMVNSSKAQTTVLFHTNMGAFVVELQDTLMPITTGNFLKLTNEKFYDGVIFHRVIINFVIQGGDPTGTGSGGPGYTIQDEFDSTLSNVTGTIAMANTGQPNSGGSQFYFNLKDNTHLDFDKAPLTSKHPVFGFVLHNYNVVEDIAKVAVNGADRPLTPVVIDSIRVLSAFSPPTSIEDGLATLKGLKVYPNPISEESVIALSNEKNTQVNIAIYDQLGRKIANDSRQLVAGDHQIPLRDILIESPAMGVYYLLVQDGKSMVRKRLVFGN